MAQAGDLHWERVSAGNYRTMFWAAGYRYKIEKDDYYANTWHVWYKWDKWTDKKKWVKVTRGYGSSQETLKHAKRVALSHNLRPRRKFKFVGRVTEEQVGAPRSYGLAKYLGFLKYQEVSRDGKLLEYQTHYMNPAAIGGEDQAKINREEEARRSQKAMEALAKVTLKIPEDAKL